MNRDSKKYGKRDDSKFEEHRQKFGELEKKFEAIKKKNKIIAKHSILRKRENYLKWI